MKIKNVSRIFGESITYRPLATWEDTVKMFPVLAGDYAHMSSILFHAAGLEGLFWTAKPVFGVILGVGDDSYPASSAVLILVRGDVVATFEFEDEKVV